MSRLLRLWLVWIVLVWTFSFPWGSLTAEPQWHRVHWIPFTDPADRPRDLLANALFFVPFGYLAMRRPSHRVLTVAALALATSVSAEAIQLFSTKRYPSGSDVTAALLGTLAGTVPTLLGRCSSKPRTWTD